MVWHNPCKWVKLCYCLSRVKVLLILSSPKLRILNGVTTCLIGKIRKPKGLKSASLLMNWNFMSLLKNWNCTLCVGRGGGGGASTPCGLHTGEVYLKVKGVAQVSKSQVHIQDRVKWPNPYAKTIWEPRIDGPR